MVGSSYCWNFKSIHTYKWIDILLNLAWSWLSLSNLCPDPKFCRGSEWPSRLASAHTHAASLCVAVNLKADCTSSYKLDHQLVGCFCGGVGFLLKWIQCEPCRWPAVPSVVCVTASGYCVNCLLHYRCVASVNSCTASSTIVVLYDCFKVTGVTSLLTFQS